MQIIGFEPDNYIYVSGLHVCRRVPLGEGIELIPATLPDNKEFYHSTQHNVDFGMLLMYENLIQSQVHITSNESKEAAIKAANALWDLVIISAVVGCDAQPTFQSACPAERLTKDSKIFATNYRMYGLEPTAYELKDDEAQYLTDNIEQARNMLDKEPFRTAIHSLASYRWHSMPRVQMAILWSGIESLFKIESEISFRLALYIAKFLEPVDANKAKQLFDDVRKLYRLRSIAVHGARSKDNSFNFVETSAQLLKKLIVKCISNHDLPDVDNLLF